MVHAIGQYAIGTRVLDRAARPAPLLWGADTLVFQLLLLNLVLQIFDGIATYVGLHIGIHEGNPLLRNAFDVWGVVPALVLFKAQACGLLLFVYWLAGAELATFALGILAAAYCTLSLVPWLCTFVVFIARCI